MKELMLGNKAFARGLYEAGCSVVSSYPGTPSTEVTEEIANKALTAAKATEVVITDEDGNLAISVVDSATL